MEKIKIIINKNLSTLEFICVSTVVLLTTTLSIDAGKLLGEFIQSIMK